MTDQERIKRLAEWMGFGPPLWNKYLVHRETGEPFSFQNVGQPGYIDFYRDWNPLTRIQDAWMLLSKCDWYQLHKRRDGMITCLVGRNCMNYAATDSPETAAICEAILKMMEADHGRD